MTKIISPYFIITMEIFLLQNNTRTSIQTSPRDDDELALLFKDKKIEFEFEP